MSGTSLDGVDVAFVEIIGNGSQPDCRLLHFATAPYESDLKCQLLKACVGNMNMREFLALDVDLGAVYAEAIKQAAKSAGLQLSQIDAVGLHGQTVWHNPNRTPNGITVQIGSAAVVAEMLGTVVVNDFRSNDVAAGGEGAPLVPFCDLLLLASNQKNRVALNVGGMANLTWLPVGATPDTLIAFDTGPGNCLIDAAMFDLKSLHFDAGGEFAAQGRVHENLLAELLDDPWFSMPPPKSTGREAFGAPFAQELVSDWLAQGVSEVDIVATLTAFTARTIAMGIQNFAAGEQPVHEVLVSGGGAHNRTLMRMLGEEISGAVIRPAEDVGISSDAKEAFCFAILAHARLCETPNNVPSVTGASRPVVGGAVYTGRRAEGGGMNSEWWILREGESGM